MDTKEIAILGTVGVIVIYAIYKLAPRTSQTIQTLVPVGTVDQGENQSEQMFRNAQLGAFGGLLELGKTQTEAGIASKALDTELGLENIRSNAQADALSIQSQTAISLAELEQALGFGQQETDLSIAQLQKDTALGLGSQALQGFELQARQRQQEISQQLQAIQQAGYDFRKQSLERQGTILSAILSAFGSQPTYSYSNAFGTASDRGPGLFSQITGFINSLLK